VKAQAHRRAAQLGLGTAVALFLASMTVLVPGNGKPVSPRSILDAAKRSPQPNLTIATHSAEADSLASEIR
jgi:hypothetical protein